MTQVMDRPETAVVAQLQRVPFGAPAEEVGSACKRDGGVIITGAISAEDVDAINRELDGPLSLLSGGDRSAELDEFSADFSGRKTKRLVHLLKYSKTYRDRVLNDETLIAYVGAMIDGYTGPPSLFASQAIEILPGEKAQDLHRDFVGVNVAFGLEGPESANLGGNAILALTNITEEMGATRVIPGSNRWEDTAYSPPQSDTVPALLDAGDIFLFTGKTVHGGGANTTTDKPRRVITTAFAHPFLIGEEAWPFVLTREEVMTYPIRVQRMLGFRSVSYLGEEPGFLWRVDARPLENHLNLAADSEVRPMGSVLGSADGDAH